MSTQMHVKIELQKIPQLSQSLSPAAPIHATGLGADARVSSSLELAPSFFHPSSDRAHQIPAW